MILLLLLIPLFIAYGILVLYYWLNWRSIPLVTRSGALPQTRISIIIPARNEAQNISHLLGALKGQSYPAELFEIIVVDDHSTDQTAEVVRSFNGVRLLQLNNENINSYKKKAIETGIAEAGNDLIVTTDADCVPPPDWLATLAAFAEEKNAVFVAAPVTIDCNSSVLQLFQAMDFMVLQAITGAAVYRKTLSMCNGANIAYSRKAFYEVKGFSGIDSIASGDDMLLMYKIWKKYPGGIHYLKSRDAIMHTAPVRSWKEFFQQRVRWASKAGKYQDHRMLPVLMLVYFFNLSFLIAGLAAILLSAGYWKYLIILWVAKTLVELPLFYSAAVFFHKHRTVLLLFFFQPLHILYTILSGFFGQTGKYEWKGRKVK